MRTVYVWLWRHLPGGLPGKLAGSLLLLVATVAVLFVVVFPYVEPRLPFNHVTIAPAPGAPPAPRPSGR